MKTNAAFTNEVLGGYLMDNNRVNVEYLAEQITITAENEAHLYEERFNTRRKTRNIAINEMMFFINLMLKYNGRRGYYASNAQVMKFDREHGGDLEAVLDIIEAEIIETRNEN